MTKKNRAFTIIELVIVIAVVAILAAVLIPTFADVIDNAKRTAAMSNARNAYTEYYIENVMIGSPAEYCVYEEDEGYVVGLHNGNPIGVYSDIAGALVALLGDLPDAYYLERINDKLYEYCIPEPEPGDPEPDIPNPTSYDVIWDINGDIKVSKKVTSVVEGSSFSVTLTAPTGYKLDGLTVTMGEEVIEGPFPGNKITIKNVTGNITIKAGVIKTISTAEIDGIVWQIGYIDASGNEDFMERDDRIYSNFIDASSGLTVVSYDNVTVCPVYYNESFDFVKIADKYESGTIEIPAPENGEYKYVRLVVHTRWYNALTDVKYGNKVSVYKKDSYGVNRIIWSVGAIDPNFYDDFIDRDGTIRTGYIPVENGLIISSGKEFTVFCYDENLKIMSSIEPETGKLWTSEDYHGITYIRVVVKGTLTMGDQINFIKSFEYE